MATLVHMHGHSIHAQLSNHFCHPNHDCVLLQGLWIIILLVGGAYSRTQFTL